MGDDIRELTSFPLPWSDEPVRPLIRGAAASIDHACDGKTWRIALAPARHERPLELEFPVGSPEAFLVSATSFPFVWLSEREVSCTARTLVALAADMTSAVRIELSQDVACSLSRRAGASCARFAVPPASPEPLTLCAGISTDARELLPTLGRDVPDEDAARLFLSFFAVLDLVAPDRFGSPTQAHAKIIAALAAKRAFFRNLESPPSFRIFDDAAAGRLAGYEARWSNDALVFLAGACPDQSFPAGARTWHLLGEGAITFHFSHNLKGLTVRAYDPYGRPRRVWGGRRSDAHRFVLRAGETITIEKA